jgi:hypothetical protein
MRKLIPIFILLILTGCAVGRKMSFENKSIRPDYTATKSLVVTFQENRTEVLAGVQKLSYCGRIKSTGQIAYNMQTKSGKPLVEEFSNSVVTSLTKLGIKTQPMAVDMNVQRNAYIEQFLKTDGERLVHFTMKQWEANATPRVVDIRYDVTWEFEVNVFNRSGDLLATKAVADRVTRDEAQLGISKEYLQKMADDIFVEQIRNLLNDPAVKASLMN